MITVLPRQLQLQIVTTDYKIVQQLQLRYANIILADQVNCANYKTLNINMIIMLNIRVTRNIQLFMKLT